MLRKIQQDEIAGFYKELYRPYIEEIMSFGGSDGMSENILRNYLCNTPLEAYVIEDGDDEEVGFVITERVSPPDLYRPMLLIMEFYIKEVFRRRGIGTKVFTEILDGLDIPVFFTVLLENTGANAFWRRQIALNGLTPVRPDYSQVQYAKNQQLFIFRKHMFVKRTEEVMC